VQELELLDENNQALTHAKYHKQEVKDAADRDRRPVSLHIPLHLERSAREYLAQVKPSRLYCLFVCSPSLC